MKKSHIVGGLVVLGAALTFVIYINKNSQSDEQLAAGLRKPESLNADGSLRSDFDASVFANSQGAAPGTPTPGADANDVKAAKIDSYVAQARLAEEFKFLDDQMEVQYEQLKRMAQPEELAMFEEMRSQLKGDDLLAKYKEALRQKFSEAELDELNEINQNPAYAQYREAQARARSPEGMKAQMDFVRTWKPSNENPERLAALKRLGEATNESKHMARMLEVLEPAMSGGQVPKSNAKETQAMRKMLLDSIDQAVLAANAANLQGKTPEQINAIAELAARQVVQQATEAKVEVVSESTVSVIGPQMKKVMAAEGR